MKKSLLKIYFKYWNNNPKKYWFKRKLFFLRWVPIKWQGWFIVLISILVFIAGVYVGETDDAPGATLLGFIFMILILILFVYWKGEKLKR